MDFYGRIVSWMLHTWSMYTNTTFCHRMYAQLKVDCYRLKVLFSEWSCFRLGQRHVHLDGPISSCLRGLLREADSYSCCMWGNPRKLHSTRRSRSNICFWTNDYCIWIRTHFPPRHGEGPMQRWNCLENWNKSTMITTFFLIIWHFYFVLGDRWAHILELSLNPPWF